jgi:hypothetical protein
MFQRELVDEVPRASEMEADLRQRSPRGLLVRGHEDQEVAFLGAARARRSLWISSGLEELRDRPLRAFGQSVSTTRDRHRAVRLGDGFGGVDLGAASSAPPPGMRIPLTEPFGFAAEPKRTL